MQKLKQSKSTDQWIERMVRGRSNWTQHIHSSPYIFLPLKFTPHTIN